MGRRFDGVTVRTGVVRIAAGIEYFVADDRVPDTHLEVQSVAERRAQLDVRLLEASAGRQRGGIRAEDELSFVAGRPLIRGIQRLLDGHLGDIEVETVRLAGATEGIAGVVGVAGSQIP